MRNPTHLLVRPGAVCAPDYGDQNMPDPAEGFEKWSAALDAATVVDESVEPVRLKRVPVADPREGGLYYGDGTEPCHACGQRPGRPHLEGCDHEVCAGCARLGREGVQAIGCDACQVAEHEVTLGGRIGGRRATVTGLGFTEAEADADARALWEKRVEAARKAAAKKKPQGWDALVAKAGR